MFAENDQLIIQNTLLIWLVWSRKIFRSDQYIEVLWCYVTSYGFVDIGTGNDLVLLGNKPLLETMFIYFRRALNQ